MRITNFIKITNPSAITFGAWKYVKKANTTNVVPMHANAYVFQNNLPKIMLNKIEHAKTCFLFKQI